MKQRSPYDITADVTHLLQVRDLSEMVPVVYAVQRVTDGFALDCLLNFMKGSIRICHLLHSALPVERFGHGHKAPIFTVR